MEPWSSSTEYDGHRIKRWVKDSDPEVLVHKHIHRETVPPNAQTIAA